MLAFEVYRNGRRIQRAGASDMEYLSATVACLAQADAEGRPTLPGKHSRSARWVRVIGRTENSYRFWKLSRLKVGDDIRFRLVAKSQTDAPVKEEKDNPAARERRHYLALKRKFETDVTPAAIPLQRDAEVYRTLASDNDRFLALEVTRNGQRIYRAGAPDMQSLYATFAWQTGAVATVRSAALSKITRSSRWLEVDGRTDNAYRSWRRLRLKRGDEVGVRLVETQLADPPIDDELDDPAVVERSERKHYLALKRRFEPRITRQR